MNNVRLEGTSYIFFPLRIAFLNISHFHLLGFLFQVDGLNNIILL